MCLTRRLALCRPQVLVENYFLGTGAITRGGSYYYYWVSPVPIPDPCLERAPESNSTRAMAYRMQPYPLQ